MAFGTIWAKWALVNLLARIKNNGMILKAVPGSIEFIIIYENGKLEKLKLEKPGKSNIKVRKVLRTKKVGRFLFYVGKNKKKNLGSQDISILKFNTNTGQKSIVKKN